MKLWIFYKRTHGIPGQKESIRHRRNGCFILFSADMIMLNKRTSVLLPQIRETGNLKQANYNND